MYVLSIYWENLKRESGKWHQYFAVFQIWFVSLANILDKDEGECHIWSQ